MLDFGEITDRGPTVHGLRCREWPARDRQDVTEELKLDVILGALKLREVLEACALEVLDQFAVLSYFFGARKAELLKSAVLVEEDEECALNVVAGLLEKGCPGLLGNRIGRVRQGGGHRRNWRRHRRGRSNGRRSDHGTVLLDCVQAPILGPNVDGAVATDGGR